MFGMRSFMNLSDAELAGYSKSDLFNEDVNEYKAYLLYRNVFEKVKRELAAYKKSLAGCNVNEAIVNGLWLYAMESSFDVIRDLEWFAKRALTVDELLRLAEQPNLLESMSKSIVGTPSPMFKINEGRLRTAAQCGEEYAGMHQISKDEFKELVIGQWTDFEKEFLLCKPSYILKHYARYFVTFNACVALLRPKEYLGRDLTQDEMSGLAYKVDDPLSFVAMIDLSVPTDALLSIATGKENV